MSSQALIFHFLFIKNQFQVLKVTFFVQSETKARLFTGKFIVFINIFVFKSSVSLLSISLQLLTCPATPLSAYDLLCNEMGLNHKVILVLKIRVQFSFSSFILSNFARSKS